MYVRQRNAFRQRRHVGDDGAESPETALEDVTNRGRAAGPLANNALQEASKTKLLYQHHREKFHMSAPSRPAIQSASAAEDRPDSVIPTAEQLMRAIPFWPDDLSGLSHQVVLNYMAENRAWNKQLREGTAALVNTRLAKTITQEEYASNRERTNLDAAECFRRARMLVRDLALREREWLRSSIQVNALTETVHLRASMAP